MARKKAQPKPREPEDQVAFLRGREARRGGIRREDAPCLAGEAWAEGWDFEDEAQRS